MTQNAKETRREKRVISFKKILFVACEAFAFLSFLHFLPTKNMDNILLSGFTVVLVGFVFAAEKLFHCRMNTALYALALIYALGPLLGDGYKLYYLVEGYDKVLHTTGGVVFAIIGSYIPVLIDEKYKADFVLRAVVAVCFSMAVSVAWEFFEFGADMLLGYDMQNDTVIHSINSYLLGAEPGITGSTGVIESIVINGMPMEGYIDIGLIDTMMDMLVETAGAIIYAVAFLIDRERHPLFRWTEKTCAGGAYGENLLVNQGTARKKSGAGA